MELNTSTQVIILILLTLGPFTVLVTVYFLVTELREQNKVARANARQNIADSHQRLALAGLQKELVSIKVKLRNNEPLSDEEESMYITHFSAIERARQKQLYQHSFFLLLQLMQVNQQQYLQYREKFLAFDSYVLAQLHFFLFLTY